MSGHSSPAVLDPIADGVVAVQVSAVWRDGAATAQQHGDGINIGEARDYDDNGPASRWYGCSGGGGGGGADDGDGDDDATAAEATGRRRRPAAAEAMVAEAMVQAAVTVTAV